MSIHSVYRRISPWFRGPRMRRFQKVIAPVRGERLLDIGGTPGFWLDHAVENEITLLNPIEIKWAVKTSAHHFAFVVGDGCALPFADQSFDVVLSNSVIEHAGTWERQWAFASEARRVGQRLWIQTPAREFFMEPHLIAPFIHWLPCRAQRRLIRNFTVRGWMERPGPTEVEAFLNEVRLLTFTEMRTLFPDCTILRERFCGLTKSYIAVRM